MHLNTDFVDKLRNSGLRPTKQRLKICEILFDNDKTFHFSVKDLSRIISQKLGEKISLATVYNTVHAFEKKEKKIIYLENEDLDPINIKKTIPGKKIKSIEVLVKLNPENS